MEPFSLFFSQLSFLERLGVCRIRLDFQLICIQSMCRIVSLKFHSFASIFSAERSCFGAG
ncbi:hypothetical protein Syun_020870 [Stephania yunnanensis]|uniref:Uncharacterized protein n=1 Tax=Stephania yunnanensis TaxID=152371 RepID=A0AAP0IER0_9MAGN